ncbi:hypothetical protein [Sansalvadorimonas verongulae]|uniref:hypothetical protein n=1 Tax=Sansalvadorimonas verongulae TaxID=2172824 RepID=UPI0012BCAA7D|nr:hypothetical protein [Sansalvadorimonas verongulae]MTI15412.1 hypothetical protein [Sansalvadorimonas verongulae]
MRLLEDSLFEGDRYQVRRLVMVNSGSSAYVELPLDKTAALLGSNNQGKTSGLHTLKLFLLPEVNFRNCENKFGFASKDREYTGLESYRYYFPSPRSFVVLEANNPRGDFCIVLHQSNQELGYGRLAVPRAYEDIKHLFWEQGEGNRGVGAHPEDLELATVISRLKKLGGRPLNDVAAIREALYTRVDPSNDDTRFCLMPLVQVPSQHMMRSIKALLQLSFDIKGADHKNLPQAIANIIDADLSTQKDVISIDFRRIQDDRERLSRNHQDIRTIREHGDKWEGLRKNYLVYQEQSGELRRRYQALLAALNEHREHIDPQLADVHSDFETANERFKEIYAQLKTLRTQVDQGKGQINTLTKDVTKLQEAVTLANEVIGREAPAAGSENPMDIHRYLDDCLKSVEKELQDIANLEKTRHALERELQLKPTLQEQVAQAEQVLVQQQDSTLSYLDAHSAFMLNSLHRGFGEMVLEPDEQQAAAIALFAQLFSPSEKGNLQFCGETLPDSQTIPFDALALKQSRTQRLHDLEDQLKNCERKIDELRRAMTGSEEQRQESAREKQKEIGEIRREMAVLTSLDFNRTSLEQKQAELEALTLQVEEGSERGKLRNSQRQELDEERERCRERQKALEAQKSSLKSAGDSLANLCAVAGLKHIAPADEVEAISPNDIARQANELNALFHNDVSEVRQNCIEVFRILVGSGIASLDPELAFRADISGHDFFDAYQKLKSEFDNIESKEQEHRIQVQNHNHDTGRQISLLDKMDLAIRNFQDRINEELSQIRISNLSGVRVDISTLDSFNTLRRELQEHGTESDRLMKESFYNRLREFCEKYLMTGHNAGRLDLEKIVRGVKFIYQINGQDEVTPQSNGTSSMVNAVLLSILMYKLVPDDVVFALPVIFDEVGSLDDSNLAELRRIVEEHNFTLLVANPTNQGNIAQHIGLWHDLFLHQMTEGNPIGKCLAIYTGLSESLTELDEGQEHEQEPVEASADES